MNWLKVFSSVLILTLSTVFINAEQGQESNRFGYNLFTRISEEKGNILYSPLSIYMAFSLVYQGASGSTAEEMGRVFYYDSAKGEETRVKALLAAVNRLDNNHRELELILTNTLWLQQDFTWKEDFLRLAREFYDSQLFTVDYRNNSSLVTRKINNHVKKSTKGQIKQIYPEHIPSETRIILANTLFFKGTWQNRFKWNDTQSRLFYSPGKEPRSVPTMHQENYLPFLQEETYKILELPYSESDLSMCIILPNKDSPLREWENSQTMELIEKSLKKREKTKVEVFLPKFKFQSKINLKPLLMDMGIMDAFIPGNADFSLMTEDGDVPYIDHVQHAACIEVNERGTKASAVTSGGGCFPTGSLVTTPRGLVPIEKCTEGTEILSYNFRQDLWIQDQVTALTNQQYSGEMIRVIWHNGDVTATENHPFFVISGHDLALRDYPDDVTDKTNPELPGCWVEAGDLQPGDILLSQRDGVIKIDRIDRWDESLLVYNITIRENRNYAVSPAGILVHNKGSEEETPAVFNADHPFYFLIMNRESGTIYFMGRVIDPLE